MKIKLLPICFALVFIGFQSCGKKSTNSNPVTGPNASPEMAVQTMIAAGKSGNYEDLKKLCNPDIKGDEAVNDWCELANGKNDLKEEYAEYFGGATIEGKERINGSSGEVDIKVEFAGMDDATIIFENIDNKWFLKGYKKR